MQLRAMSSGSKSEDSFRFGDERRRIRVGTILVRWRALRISAAFLVLTTVLVGRASGDGETAHREPSQVLAGMMSCIESLHSGAFTATWDRSPVPGTDTQAQYFVVFDFDSGKFRFDLHYTPSNRRIQEIRRSDERILHVVGSKIIDRRPPGEDTAVAGAVPLDPRVVGLVSQSEFHFGATLGWFKHFLDTDVPAAKIADDGDGLYRITWEKTEKKVFDGETYFTLFRRITWVNANHGFTPSRTEVWYGGGRRPDDDLKRLAAVDARWIKRGDTWVPVECVLKCESPVQEEDRISIAWQAVNSPVAESAFTPEGLNAPPETLIGNQKSGPMVIESRVGAPTIDDIKTESTRQTNIWLWCVGSAIGLVSIAALVRRRAVAARTGPRSAG